MLRGEAQFKQAVVLGDGPHAGELLNELKAAQFCAAVGGRERLSTADLVIVDTDPSTTAGTLLGVIAEVAPSVLVTDLCPVKTGLLRQVEEEIPPGYGYVASSIFPGADGRLRGATVGVMPVMGSVPEAIERTRLLWEQLGAATVLQLDPQTHDLWVAAGQLKGVVDRVVAAAAGVPPAGLAPRGAASAEAVARNDDFLAWLVEQLRSTP